MTPRQARRSLGTRSARRRGTKAALISATGTKGPAGRKNRRQAPPRVCVLVRARLGGSSE